MTNNRNDYPAQYRRGLARKVRAIEEKGGKCEKCGYSANYAALEFHHTNESEKEFPLDMRHFSNRTWERLCKEMRKCSLLCANCHREHHYPNLKKKEADELINSICKPSKSPVDNLCDSCGAVVSYKAASCRPCSLKKREKIDWPKTEVLIEMVKKSGLASVARHLGVSDSAIRKRIKRY